MAWVTLYEYLQVPHSSTVLQTQLVSHGPCFRWLGPASPKANFQGHQGGTVARWESGENGLDSAPKEAGVDREDAEGVNTVEDMIGFLVHAARRKKEIEAGRVA